MADVCPRVYMFPAGRSGVALYSYKLANALAGKGMDVHLFIDDAYELDDFPAKFTKVNILSGRYNSYRLGCCRMSKIGNILFAHILNWYRFAKAIKRDGPDIVHVQPLFYLVDWLGMSLVKNRSRYLVATVHDVIPHRFFTKHLKAVELLLLKWTYEKADKLIVHSKINKQEFLRTYPFDERRILVIPHGEYSVENMTGRKTREEARAALGIDGDAEVVLFFGFIRKSKGIDVLIKAFDRVAGKVTGAVLVIAGSPIQGESFEEYQRLIDKMVYRDRVYCFVKYIEYRDLSLFFEAADVVAVPYREFFSQSGVLHLAQGFGKAVVATDVGGLPEVVEAGVTGLIVPAGEIEPLGKAMTYLLENKEVRETMGTTARIRGAEKFGWEGIAEATIQYAYGFRLESGKDGKNRTESGELCVEKVRWSR